MAFEWLKKVNQKIDPKMDPEYQKNKPKDGLVEIDKDTEIDISVDPNIEDKTVDSGSIAIIKKF